LLENWNQDQVDLGFKQTPKNGSITKYQIQIKDNTLKLETKSYYSNLVDADAFSEVSFTSNTQENSFLREQYLKPVNANQLFKSRTINLETLNKAKSSKPVFKGEMIRIQEEIQSNQ